MFCTNCGFPIPEEATNCPNCGFPVTEKKAPETSVLEPAAENAQPEPVYTQPEPVAVQPEPVALQPEPVAVQPEPVAVQPEPVYTQPAEPVYYQPVAQNYSQPPATNDPDAPSSTKILIFGIIGAALARISIFGIIPYGFFALMGAFGIPAIILSALALKSAGEYESYYGEFSKKAKIGKILAKVALIVGIITCACFVLYMIIISCILIFAIGGKTISDIFGSFR